MFWPNCPTFLWPFRNAKDGNSQGDKYSGSGQGKSLRYRKADVLKWLDQKNGPVRGSGKRTGSHRNPGGVPARLPGWSEGRQVIVQVWDDP